MKLYKYRTIADSFNYPNLTKNALENNYIWFSSPDSFNDPFDCNLKDHYCTFSQEQIERDSTGKLAAINRDQYKKVFYKSYLANGVACFSETYDNILLWSHYADSHRGVCLEFDFDRLPELNFLFSKVFYTENYPQINFLEFLEPGFEGELRYIYKTLFTKYKVWEYEKEVRIVINGFNNKALHYSPCFLSAIYLGCNIKEEDRQWILHFAQNSERTCPLLVYQCIASENSFCLETELVNEFSENDSGRHQKEQNRINSGQKEKASIEEMIMRADAEINVAKIMLEGYEKEEKLWEEKNLEQMERTEEDEQKMQVFWKKLTRRG